MSNLKEQTFIVTGGSSGIGKAIVEQLLELNANVVNADINELQIEKNNYLFVRTDITDLEEVNSLVKETLNKFKKIDGVINNAGINIPRLLVDGKKQNSEFELDLANYNKMMDINVKGTFLISQQCAREFIKNKKGVIINISSECGLEGSEGQGCYAATKAAIYSFTRTWAKELGKYNIRVVGVAPGILEETGLRTLSYETALAYTRGKSIEELRSGYSNVSTIPLARSGKLKEVADLVSYLASDNASYITGTTINIAGGKTRG
ncbi:sorbitol-6-phosphate 2-dehydrogenase [Spiroplasma chinense]|uniref:Sorbitol-6-phosphate 2-dehydrogenase n=1 Tax=Spiroplasma chinense TaxID=216932 RepID=A0A5B9Y324_9MOLU|nr:SDR family oxidoreductase [Spiroplasma chinense]QEH61460.1 sorbitol-6-phosphate 2-dehydrogenase [Spiroplasma chinense]